MCPILPPEVWEHVFQFLSIPDLKQVRLTCATWTQIVDCCGLRFKTDVNYLMEGVVMDDEFNPNVTARNVVIDNCIVENVDSWWPRMGFRLVELKLIDGQLDFPALVEMLRGAPYLKRFTMERTHCISIEEVVVDFRLNNLEALSITELSNATVLKLFRQAIPRLKQLSLSYSGLSNALEEEVVLFIKAVQHSLEVANLRFTKQIIDATSSANLKSVEFSWMEGFRNAPIKDFAAMHPSLEDFNIVGCPVNNMQILEDTGRLLPNLKRFTIKLESFTEPAVPSFLEVMPRLEYLFIFGPYIQRPMLKFNNLRNSNLKNLDLYMVQLDPTDLRRFFKNAPQIEILGLHHCGIPSWSGLFSALKELPMLRQLELSGMQVPNWDSPPSNFADKMYRLDLLYLDIPADSLLMLLGTFPQLTVLNVHSIRSITDAVVLKLCQKLPNLQTLNLSHCPIRDASAHYIRSGLKKLDHLTLASSHGTQGLAMKKLEMDINMLSI